MATKFIFFASYPIIILNSISFCFLIFLLDSHQEANISLRNIALIRLLFSSFLLMNMVFFQRFFLKSIKRPFLSKLSSLILRISPYLEIVLFLNIELLFYKDIKGLNWLGCFRMCVFFIRILINYIENPYKPDVRLFSIFAILNLLGLYLVYFDNWKIFFVCSLEIATLGYILEKFLKLILTINENKEIPLIKSLNLIEKNVLILKRCKNTYKIVFFNDSFQYTFQIPTETPIDFLLISSKITGFSFAKTNQATLISNLDIAQSQHTLSSLKDILLFTQQLSKTRTPFYFTNANDQKLTINSFIIDHENYYNISIENSEKGLNSTESTNRLLNSFSHELKTPLNGSIPLLEELESLVSKEALILLERALSSLKLLENSLNNIMDYSLHLSNQLLINLSMVNIEELLGEVFLVLKPQIIARNLNFDVEMEGQLENTSIMTDPARLKQIFLNLIQNSLQFTRTGGITVLIKRILKEPLTIGLSIKDTGSGIESLKLEKLKSVLYQNESDNQRFLVNSTGSCLGLIISQTLALLLGKQGLKIQAEVNKGTEIDFPIIDLNQNHESIDTLSKNNRKIMDYSKKIYFIKAKNLTLQRSFHESLLEMEEVPIYDLNLGKLVHKYDFPTKKLHSDHVIDNTLSILIPKITLFSIKESISEVSLFSDNIKKCICEDALLVDDDIFNLLSLQMILKGFQVTCVKAQRGQEAIEKALKHFCGNKKCKKGFKIIFMDYQMPEMDGVQAAKEIIRLMAEKKLKEAPIIGCTAFIAKDEVSNCLQAGMKDVIFKPLSRNVLNKILKNWI